MDTVVRIFASIADAENCAIGLAHHTRKHPGGRDHDYGADDMRGASATRDAVRAARMLNQMGAKEAGEVGIQEHDRTSYFRVDRVKGNNAPPEKAVWRRFVTIDLPNGDSVGVVAPWLFPGQDLPSAEMTEAHQKADILFMALLARLTLNGRTVSDKSGVNHAPLVFSREPEAKTAKIGKKPSRGNAEAVQGRQDPGRHHRGGGPQGQPPGGRMSGESVMRVRENRGENTPRTPIHTLPERAPPPGAGTSAKKARGSCPQPPLQRFSRLLVAHLIPPIKSRRSQR